MHRAGFQKEKPVIVVNNKKKLLNSSFPLSTVNGS